MFESLSERFEGIFSKLRSKGTLRESDVDEVMREIRLALLEADVNFVVVKTMLERIRERAIGTRVHEALNPAQQVVNPLLVGAALQRPAAVEQLRTLGGRVGVPVYSQPGDPVAAAKAGVEEARRLGRDICIVDTAGRLAIDTEMMDQVRRISEATQPDYTFLVVDAMTGQDAVTTAESFDATLALDGVVLTKLDGDARGGAALSVKEVVGKPIAFASTGEKVEAEAAAARLLEGKFTLDDFLEQLQQVRKMGPLQNLMTMMPGVPKELKDTEVDEGKVGRVEAIIRSMTPDERIDPTLIDGSRRPVVGVSPLVSPSRSRDSTNLVSGSRFDPSSPTAHHRRSRHRGCAVGATG